MTVRRPGGHPLGIGLLALLTANSCSAPEAEKLPVEALHNAIASAVGDPATCVLIAEADGKVLYRYGEAFNCVRGLPACDRPGDLSATEALRLAHTPGGRAASCPSLPDGSRMVGWAEGPVASRMRTLVYSAMMEGQTALPGHEIASRLEEAFAVAGL